MIRNLLRSSFFLLLSAQTTLSTDKTEWKRVDNVRGSFVAAIYETTNGNQSYIRKTFKSEEEYKTELEKVLALKEPLQQYMNKKTQDMANFALYHLHDSSSITYVKANGRTFWDFFITAATTKIYDPFHRASALRSVRNAGNAVAKFHICFKSPNNEDSFLTCTHGDMSPSNVFFVLWNGEVTFID